MQTSSPNAIGNDMRALIERLYPICRSITGDGVRETLAIIREQIPLDVKEVPSGTQVFDWTVPREWNIRDAWIDDTAGKRLVDFGKLNLHVVSYSTPVRARLPFAELKKHLFTLPDYPDRVPYRTSYYNETWGFCLSENELLQFRTDAEYEVCIDSSLAEGHLTYGELLIKGDQAEEVLISCHVCHPSLANDNLSGIGLAVALARHMAAAPRRYSYRFLFIPGTIGSITWLALNENVLPRIQHGLVLTCVGDPGSVTYKRSRRGNAEIDRAVAHVLNQSGEPHRLVDFSPYGYDERQYCSPGFNLPVGCLMRSPHGQFPEYHNSGDNLEFIETTALVDSFTKCCAVFDLIEHNRKYLNTKPKCEPQLGKRGLYRGLAADKDRRLYEMALLWILNLSDGSRTLLDIAERSQIPFPVIHEAARALVTTDLLVEAKS